MPPPPSPGREQPRPIPGYLLDLAPLELANHRKLRYVGDDVCVPCNELRESDQQIVRWLYDVLTELLLAISNPATDDARRWQEVAAWTRRHDPDELIDRVRKLGQLPEGQTMPEQMAKAVHDIRGGALSALLARLQMAERLTKSEQELQAIFVLARDHHKIMRSVVTGLDDRRREADRKPRSHDVALILAKWHESVVGPKLGARPVRLYIDCRHEGPLTECCLESAAIDRIFYNLVNNACRHVAGDRLDMVIFPLPPAPGHCLRFVLSNSVAERDARFLHALLAAGGGDSASKGTGLSLEGLFNPRVSSTGSGFGLTVVGDLVAGAFGLRDRNAALHGRYVGAVLVGDVFRVWFHWPIAQVTPTPKLDDYHQPGLSLSEG